MEDGWTFENVATLVIVLVMLAGAFWGRLG